MLGKIIASGTVISIVALWVLLMTTTPASAGPVGILAIFGFMYISALGVLTFLLYGASMVMSRVTRVVFGRAQLEPLALRKAYYYASVVALAPVMLVAMQSVNEVGVYQLLLVVIFVTIAWVYVTKRTT
jgi:hypothetical protein